MRAFSLAIVLMVGCGSVLPTSGGGMVDEPSKRRVNPADVALADGFAIEVIATGMTFPTGVTFDDRGRIYVVESGYSYGEVFRVPKLLRVEPSGQLTTIASGEQNGPWTGVTFADGKFYVAEGGAARGGRILRIDEHGAIEALLDNLP